MATRPERDRRIPVGRPRRRRCRSRRSARSPITRRFRTCRRNSFSTTCPRFSGCCSRTIVFARCPTPSERARLRCRIPIRRSTRSSSRARSCSCAPAPSATAAPDSRRPRRPQAPPARSFDFTTSSSQCPRPGDTVTPARFAFAACPPRLARNARTYEIALSIPTPGPTGLLPAGTKIRRTSSDPGRALLTGFVGGACPRRTTGTNSTCPDFAGSARPPRTSTTTAPPRSRRSSITTSSSSSACEANASRQASCRRSRRPTACTSIGGRSRRARRAPGVPAKALARSGPLDRRFRAWEGRCGR